MIRHTYIFFIKIISIDKYTGLQMKYTKADCEHAVDAADFSMPSGYDKHRFRVVALTNKDRRQN